MLDEYPNSNTIQNAIHNFIQTSKDTSITVPKIKQLRKDCNTKYKSCLNFMNYTIRISTYKNVYLVIELPNKENTASIEYILKFDKPSTLLYFSDEFSWSMYTVRDELKKIRSN